MHSNLTTHYTKHLPYCKFLIVFIVELIGEILWEIDKELSVILCLQFSHFSCHISVQFKRAYHSRQNYVLIQIYSPFSESSVQIASNGR